MKEEKEELKEEETKFEVEPRIIFCIIFLIVVFGFPNIFWSWFNSLPDIYQWMLIGFIFACAWHNDSK